MKTISIITLSLCVLSWPGRVSADDYVRGYYRQDGTYVQPHFRSEPDNSPFNNFSNENNVNPYTGERGTVSPEPQIAPPPLEHAPVKNWGSGLNPPKSSAWLKPDGWEGFE